MGLLNSLELGNWYAKVSRSDSCESISGTVGVGENPVTMDCILVLSLLNPFTGKVIVISLM